MVAGRRKRSREPSSPSSSSSSSLFEVVEPFEEVPEARRALERLPYEVDVTQPMGLGTALAVTKVKRVLVGDEGATYKYLGLRLFAAPWPKELSKLDAALKNRAKALGAAECEFTASLVNKMENCSHEQAVSWHADSCLEHNSTIAVYQVVDGAGWRLGIRECRNAEGPQKRGGTPGEARHVPLVQGASAYFMLDDFNHHHQHAVLAGSGVRYSSTHRVARTRGHSASWVLGYAKSVQLSPSNWRAVSRAVDVLEFEWLCQWYVQGLRRNLEASWCPVIAKLEAAWLEFENVEKTRYDALLDAGGGTAASSKRAKKKRRLVASLGGGGVYDAAIEDFEAKRAKRDKWRTRERDKAYCARPPDLRPVSPPPFLARSPLPDLEAAIAHLRAAKEAYLATTTTTTFS
ncbi:hypothetical protein CTAYLR_008444 [Chrysophaeum taylorii]|uniref:Alpha-ketoglutarate-dependent dioxygenase FTO n=1 Tax=Chrysophaeum taylorii TaxID=2483200 RepID=A0AAD7XPX2_9STRA|nr:hypothetical protein CTAYLR_008444 [Chrysophaeum taylorii]